jgi:hypothetical protein
MAGKIAQMLSLPIKIRQIGNRLLRQEIGLLVSPL